MKFHVKRATARFGRYNTRPFGGQSTDHAADILFMVTAQSDILEMLFRRVTADGEERGKTLIEELYTSDGNPSRPDIGEIALTRKPEGVRVTIWDNKAHPLVLPDCNLKDLKVELRTPNEVLLSGKIQSKYTEKQLVRIDRLMNQNADVEMEAEMDMFDPPQDPESDGE